MNVRCALLALLIPLAAGAAPKPPEPAPEAPVSAPKNTTRGGTLSAGDQVSVEIVEDKDAPVRKLISDTGDLDVPYIGRVHVAGKSCSDAEAQIKKLLEQDYYHHATVRVSIDQFNPHSGTGPAMIAMAKVNISGDVRAPGPQEFPKSEKVTISALVLKSGPTLYSDLGKVRVTRRTKGEGTETITVNVNHVLKEGKLNEDVEARDGDYIHVPRRPIVF